MGFSDSSIDDFRFEVQKFLVESQATGVACVEYGTILPPALIDAAQRWQHAIAAAQFAGIDWAKKHHGQGLSEAHSVIWYEECARAGIAPYANFQGYVLTAGALRAFGTAEQVDTHLPGILDGSVVWCQLFSEPNSGSDLSSLMTRAEPDGEGWRISGQKIWTSTAQVSQWGILLARTDSGSRGARGISFMLIDMTQPEIDVRPIQQMTGDAEFCEVFFTDVEVPADAVLGAVNDGWRVAMEVLIDERGGAGGAGVISLGQRLDALIDGVTDRGQTLDPLARSSVAHLLGRGRALQSLMERSGGDARTANVAKLFNSDLGYAEAALGSALEGAHGMLNGPVTDRLLYSPGMRIAGGSSEIQRNIIGERTLGLPREPQPEG